MCIVCNAADSEAAAEAAARFLRAWERAQTAMDEAARAMLVVSKTMPAHDDRRRYDHLHKRMVSSIRQWNRLEQDREAIEPHQV